MSSLIHRLQQLYLRYVPRLKPPLRNEDEPGVALSPISMSRKQQAMTHLLPKSLQMAFSKQPLKSGDPRFVGRLDEIVQLKESLELWRELRGQLTAVVGPHGAGLTSLLNQVRDNLRSDEAVTFLSLSTRPCSEAEALRLINSIFDFETVPATVSEMAMAINAASPRVILIDDAHMLLARKMGNQRAIQTIGALMVTTQTRHCWIVGCAEQAWRRLSFLYQSDRFFNRIVRIEHFSGDELLEIVERRFYGLGYEWALKKELAENDKDPISALIKSLRDISGGLAELSFLLLLLAMEVDAETKVITLQKFHRLDISVLKECDEDELFSLAEIFVHGIMDQSEHENLFRINTNQSLLRLERLRSLGVLERVNTDDPYTSNRYYLAPLLVQATVAHLVNSNRLY